MTQQNGNPSSNGIHASLGDRSVHCDNEELVTRDDATGDYHSLETVTSFTSDCNLDDDIELFSPSSLLIESLIEQLCKLLENDQNSQKKLYLVICKKLHEMKLIDNSYLVEEFNFMRAHYQKALYQLLSVFKSSNNTLGDATKTVHLTTNLSPVRRKSPNRVLPKLDRLFDWSRYRNEYDELSFIAHGGFGQVFKARNKLDGGIYAIKKICLRYKNISSFLQSLREVQTLAKVNNANIVSYKAAWLEPIIISSSKISRNKGSVENLTNEARLPVASTDSSSDIVFVNSDGENNDSEDHDSSPRNNLQIVPSCANKLVFQDGYIFGQEWAMLFIQMELCSQTLRQWLDRRNEKIFSSNDLSQCDTQKNLLIFLQVVRGIEYIHSKCIVHHDIKPSNVFISHDEAVVKVGDFGLSCSVLPNVARTHSVLNAPTESQLLANATSVRNESQQEAHRQAHFGTKLYSAPEQLKGICDPKSDIYSLGILLLEIMVPFRTDMERVRTICKLRNGQFHQTFHNVDTQIKGLLTRLVSKRNKDRPSAEELCSIISAMTDNLIHGSPTANKDDVIRKLREELLSKDKWIAALESKLSAMESKNDN